MTALVVILSLLVGALVVALALALRARGASGYRQLVGERVVVQMADGRAIRCVLDRVYCDSYSLRHPEHLVPGGDPRSLGGEMLVAASEVPLIQRCSDAA